MTAPSARTTPPAGADEPPGPGRELVSTRTAVIILFAGMIGLLVGALVYLTRESPAVAVIAATLAALASLTSLNEIIGR